MGSCQEAKTGAPGPPVFGLWELVGQRSQKQSTSNDRQLSAARYLIGDLPVDETISSDAARDLLAVRAYVVGLLVSIDRRGPRFHPREVMWWLLREAYLDPAILEAIRRWSKDRFFEDRGPSRVGATRYYDPLSELVRSRCQLKPPSDAECLAVRDSELRAYGLDALLSKQSPTIDYSDSGETTTRRLSEVTLNSRWPWWSYWLINAPSLISVSAFCHLRQDYRTFAAFKIVGAR